MLVSLLGSLEDLDPSPSPLTPFQDARWHDIPKTALKLVGDTDVDAINRKIILANELAQAALPEYGLESVVSDPAGDPTRMNIVRATECLDFAYRHRGTNRGQYHPDIPWHEVFAAYALGKYRHGLEVAAQPNEDGPEAVRAERTSHHMEEARKALGIAQALAQEQARRHRAGKKKHNPTNALKRAFLIHCKKTRPGNVSDAARRFLRSKGIKDSDPVFEKRLKMLTKAHTDFKKGRLSLDDL